MSGNPYYVHIPKETIGHLASQFADLWGVSYTSAVSSILRLCRPANTTTIPRYSKGLNGQILRWGKPLIHKGGKP